MREIERLGWQKWGESAALGSNEKLEMECTRIMGSVSTYHDLCSH